MRLHSEGRLTYSHIGPVLSVLPTFAFTKIVKIWLDLVYSAVEDNTGTFTTVYYMGGNLDYFMVHSVVLL